MENNSAAFVIVIHPDTFERSEIVSVLAAVRAVPVNVMVYKEWIVTEVPNDFTQILILGNGSLVYADTIDQKIHLRTRINALIAPAR